MQSELLEMQQCGKIFDKIFRADIEKIFVEDELFNLFAQVLNLSVPSDRDYSKRSAARERYMDRFLGEFSKPINIDGAEFIDEGITNVRHTISRLNSALSTLNEIRNLSENLYENSFIEFDGKLMGHEKTLYDLFSEILKRNCDKNVVQKGLAPASAEILLDDIKLLTQFELNHMDFLSDVYTNSKYDGLFDKEFAQYMSDAERKRSIEQDLKFVIDMSDCVVKISLAQNEDIAKFAFFSRINNPTVRNIVVDTPLMLGKLQPNRDAKPENIERDIKIFLNRVRSALNLDNGKAQSGEFDMLRLSEIGANARNIASSGFEVLDFIDDGKKLFSGKNKQLTTPQMSEKLMQFCDELTRKINDYKNVTLKYDKNAKALKQIDMGLETIVSLAIRGENFNLTFIEEEHDHNIEEELKRSSERKNSRGSAAYIHLDKKSLVEKLKQVKDFGERLSKFNNFDVYSFGEEICSKAQEISKAISSAENDISEQKIKEIDSQIEHLKLQVIARVNDRFIPIAKNEIFNIMDTLSEEPRVFADDPVILTKNSIQPAYAEYIAGLKGVKESVGKFTELYGNILEQVIVGFDRDKILKVLEAYAKQGSINETLDKVLSAKFDVYAAKRENG